MKIVTEGRARKFVTQVQQNTFSGPYAVERSQPVIYVTERCVFQLTKEGLELIEVAPGIDIERDILAHMDFAPIVRNPVPMDARIFRDEPMDLISTCSTSISSRGSAWMPSATSSSSTWKAGTAG